MRLYESCVGALHMNVKHSTQQLAGNALTCDMPRWMDYNQGDAYD
jgi:hypothetical protein